MRKLTLLFGFLLFGSFTLSNVIDLETLNLNEVNHTNEIVQSSPKKTKCYNYVYDENGKIIGKVEVPCPDEIIIIKD